MANNNSDNEQPQEEQTTISDVAARVAQALADTPVEDAATGIATWYAELDADGQKLVRKIIADAHAAADKTAFPSSWKV